jgi:hypothetical protein
LIPGVYIAAMVLLLFVGWDQAKASQQDARLPAAEPLVDMDNLGYRWFLANRTRGADPNDEMAAACGVVGGPDTPPPERTVSVVVVVLLRRRSGGGGGQPWEQLGCWGLLCDAQVD